MLRAAVRCSRKFNYQIFHFQNPSQGFSINPFDSTEVICMNETTKEQIQQSINAYGALLKHINR